MIFYRGKSKTYVQHAPTFTIQLIINTNIILYLKSKMYTRVSMYT